MNKLDLGIVIVNYNVRDLLRDCLASVFDSRGKFALEVCVVDNGSTDGSADRVEAEFPQVRVIRTENRGYAVGNNLGLRYFGYQESGESGIRESGIGESGIRESGIGESGNQVSGNQGAEHHNPIPDTRYPIPDTRYPIPDTRYLLLLNPDTVLPPSALAEMLAFMEAHPQAGVVGPRLVREDGSLDRACRRSFPTPEVALYRLSGLSKLFPRSRRFGRYNLTYLPPDVTTEVDSVVGAFMLIRAEVIAQIGLLDERYFMYAEDLDFCYRAKQRGWQVWYNADVTVLHYKGQSSRQRSSAANVHFYRTMRLFHDKHFKDRTFFLVNWLIHSGIGLLGGWALLRDRLRPAGQRGVASAVPVKGE